MELRAPSTVEAIMKRDGRTLDHATLETIRLMAIERVAEGESPATVIESYGFNRTTIYKWISKALHSRAGVAALGSTVGTGRPRTLTPRQEQQVFRWVNGRDPRQYGLDFGLWTRAVVAELIERKFGVRLCLSSVGALLERLGLSPQKPLQRAYQRDPQAVELRRQSRKLHVEHARLRRFEVRFQPRARRLHPLAGFVRGRLEEFLGVGEQGSKILRQLAR